MIVSWNWLKEYVQLDMPAGEVERRFHLRAQVGQLLRERGQPPARAAR